MVLKNKFGFLSLKQLKQTISNHRFYANSISLVFNSAMGAGLGFFYWMIVARIYHPQEVGLGSAVISASSLLAFLGSLGLGNGLIRFLPNSGKKAPSLINTSLTIGGIFALLVSVVFLVGLPWWNPNLSFVSDNPVFSTAFVCFIVVITIMGLVNQVFISLGRSDLTIIQSAVSGVVKMGIVVVMAAAFKTFGIFASWGLGATAALLISLIFLVPGLMHGYRPMPGFNSQVARETIQFSFGNFIADGLGNTPGWLLPLIIVSLKGGEANAYFYVSWALSGLVFAIPNATSLSIFAEGSGEESSIPRNLRRSLKLMAMLVIPAVLLMFLLGNKLLLLFGGSYSEGGKSLLLLLTISVFPLGFNVNYLGILRVQKKIKEMIILIAITVVVILPLSYFLIRHYGILGSGYAWLAGQCAIIVYTLPRIIAIARRKVT
jgi:O-antigen/teichoic acid export membrane protein